MPRQHAVDLVITLTLLPLVLGAAAPSEPSLPSESEPGAEEQPASTEPNAGELFPLLEWESVPLLPLIKWTSVSEKLFPFIEPKPRAEEQSPSCPDGTEHESGAAIEQERRQRLYDEGEAAYKREDFIGAIGPWQRLYDTVSLCERISLFAQLGNAHWRAYQQDKQEDHLHKAKAMFEMNLEATLCDKDASRDTQDQLGAVNKELHRLEGIRAERELEVATRKAVAEERQRQWREDRVERRAKEQEERDRYGVYSRAGASLVGLGVASLATAVAGLGLGERVDREGRKLATSPDASLEDVEDLVRKGRAYNRLAIATGVMGGAMVISGATVLVVASVRLKRAKKQAQGHVRTRTRVAPSLFGVEVRF